MIKKLWNKYKHFISNLILIWSIIILYRTNSYYIDFLKPQTQLILLYLALFYSLISLAYYTLRATKNQKLSKGTYFFLGIKKLLLKINYLGNSKKSVLTHQEKNAILFTFVKLFFIPIMLNFVLNNFSAFLNQLVNILESNSFFNIYSFNNLLFPFILTTLFLIDTLWFAFGYSFETGFLKNKIKSVDSTFFGWFVALICYPPFNTIATKFIDWHANEYILYSSDTITFIYRILIVLLLSIYVWATLALGAKSSNLTNRGIVSRGPYKYIRHPAYISKNLAWWLTIIPVLSIPAIISMTTWSFIYHLRSLTEERHLKQDQEYIKYCKKVKYKYIPGIY